MISNEQSRRSAVKQYFPYKFFCLCLFTDRHGKFGMKAKIQKWVRGSGTIVKLIAREASGPLFKTSQNSSI